MDKKCVVEFNNVSKIFTLNSSKDKNKKIKKTKFYALKDISFKAYEGDVIGILGSNGSGKSTLSSIIAGISTQDDGKVKIVGEQSLIAINAGLNNQLTGIENIELKGVLLGLSKKEIDEVKQGVIDFSELGDFIYQPVKSYSSGMKSRLGFAISVALNPDILIIDEALSVGDKVFAEKCVKKIKKFKEDGKTIFFVSHSLAQIKKICDKCLWIEGGFLREYGDIEEVSEKYSEFIETNINADDKKKFREEAFEKRLVKNTEKRNLISRILGF